MSFTLCATPERPNIDHNIGKLQKLTMPNTRRPKVQRRKDARPTEIIEAGIKEFAAHGFAGARLDRIAKAAGISKGTVYLYYDSKEALFLAAIEKYVVEVMAENETALDGFDGSTQDVLIRLLTGVYNKFAEGQAQILLRILVAEGNRIPEVVETYHQISIRRGTALLERILRRGIARGEVSETAILQTPQVVIAPAIFFALHSMMFGNLAQLDHDTYFQAHVEMVLNGVLKS